MNSGGIQQNFICFLQNTGNEVPKDFNKRLCCEKCRFSTKDIDLFERHVAQHEEVTFTCTLCNHISYSRVESQRHSVTHKGSFPYRCNWCSYGAVRRDYMVKHIQRIHGKPANGSFTTLSTAKMEHLVQQQTTDLCTATSRTLSEPVKNVNVVTHTAGNVFNLIPSASQPRTTAPYLVVRPVEQTTSNQTHLIYNTATAQSVTSTTCILPVTKTVATPYNVASTSHTMGKVQPHSISNLSNFAMNEVDYRLAGKIPSGKAPSPSAIPRVHVSIPADRTTQQKVGPTTEKTVIQSKTNTNSQVICLAADHAIQQNLLHSHLGSTTEKTVIQSNTFANNQVLCLSANHDIQQKPLHPTQVGANPEKIVLQSKVAPRNVIDLEALLQTQVGANSEKNFLQSKVTPMNMIDLEAGNNPHLKTLLNNPVTLFGQRDLEARNVPAALLAQRPANSGVVRNIPVAHAVQRSVPSGAHPSSPVERFGQGAPSFSHGVQNAEKPNRQKTRPNILGKAQPNILGKTRPNIVVKPPEKVAQSSQSSMQVELLSPVNQPIQHNKPLTVSCPEEITIPAGCLVELVEVKNVNGGRELELRVVPQQQSGPQPGSSKYSTTVDSSRLSFKCKVATDDSQQRPSSKSSTIPKPQLKGSSRKELFTGVTVDVDVDVDVKDEPEVIEQVPYKITVTQTPGSLSGGHHGASRSLARPSELLKVIPQPSTGHKNTAKATELVTQIHPVQLQGRTMPNSVSNKTVPVQGLGSNASSSQASVHRKQGNVEPTFQGFPVISSVFSLCPRPDASKSGIRTKVGILSQPVVGVKASKDSGSKGSVEKLGNSVVCRKDLKTEEGTGLFTENAQKPGQKRKKKIDTMVPAKFVKDDKSFQTAPNVLKSKIIPEMCNSLADALRTATTNPLQEMNQLSKNIFPTSSRSLLDSSSPTQTDLTLPMYPTVALPRIPSLDFYSLLESAKVVPGKAVGEESVTARPVLCCTSNQQNMQGKAIKLILKRKRTETENKDSGQDQHPLLASFHIQPPSKKRKKEKKREKKHKSSKVTLKLHEVLVNGRIRKLWLTPLKEDQLVKGPAPYQPVVVLNHPNPLFQMKSVSVQDYKWVTSAQSPHMQPETTSDKLPVNHCPSLKMKLKKVEGQTYQVTELLLKGVSERAIV